MADVLGCRFAIVVSVVIGELPLTAFALQAGGASARNKLQELVRSDKPHYFSAKLRGGEIASSGKQWPNCRSEAEIVVFIRPAISPNAGAPHPARRMTATLISALGGAGGTHG